MKRFMTAVLGLLAVGGVTPVASATFIYEVHFSDPSSNGPGKVTVDGTITVAHLGTLGAADVTDYALTFTSARNPNATLTLAGRAITITGDAVVTASAASLSVSLPPSTVPKSSEVQFASPTSSMTSIYMIFYSGPGVTPIRLLTNGAPIGTTPADSALTDLGVGGPFVMATAPAAVPEPSSLVTSSLGGLIGLGYWLRCRRRAA